MDSRATDNTALITILIVMIITVSSTVGYAATSSVGESSTTARTSSSASAVACTQPQVTAVSPITTNASATIVIKGCGFGNNPETVVNPYVQDGTVDTVESDVSPSMAIIDGNPAGSWAWEAGFAINSNTPDSIGIHLASWNDTTIVIDGLGSELGPGGSGLYSLSAGDPISIIVVGPNCTAATAPFPPFPPTCTATYQTTA